MPGFVRTAGTMVICAHGGQVKPTAPNPRVKVMSQPALTQAPPYVIAGCANPPPPANVGPGVTAMNVMGALRVKLMGQPVLCPDNQAICTPTGTPVTVIPVQMRVKGM